MKKINKSILTIGTVISIIAPVTAVVACGSSKTEEDYDDDGQFYTSRPQSIRTKTSASVLASYLKSHSAEYGELTKDAVNKITLPYLQKIAAGDKEAVPADVIATVNLIEKALQSFAFATNLDGATTDSGARELNTFVKENAFSPFLSSAGGRSPFLTESESGVTKYAREDKGFYLRTDATGLPRLFDTDAANGDGSWWSQNSISDATTSMRIFDDSYVSGSAFATTEGAAAAFSIIRTRESGKDVASAKNGVLNWDSSIKRYSELTKGLSLSVNGGAPFTSINKGGSMDPELVTQLNTVNASPSISIKVEPGHKYAKSSGGDIVESKETFKAADFATGLIRAIYASQEVRQTGKIAGVDTGLPIIDKASQDFLDKEFDSPTDNQNLYLLGLYGLDVKKTIVANIDPTTKLPKPDATEFKLIFKDNTKITPTALQMFTDSNLITPAPTDYIQKLGASANADDWGVKYGLTNYGINKTSGTKVDPSTTFHLSPYLYTNYDVNEQDGYIEAKKNPFYMDDSSNAVRKVEEYRITIKREGADPNAYQQARLDAFMQNVDTSHEYMLNPEVNSVKSMLAQASAYKHIRQSNRAAATQNAQLTWVPFQGSISHDSGFNNLGRKLFFGHSKLEDIAKSTDAIDEFYDGTGAEARAVINQAINWYTVAQAYLPSQHKTFTPNLIDTGWLKTSGLTKPGDGWVSYLDSIDTMEKIYGTNMGNLGEALKSSKYKDAQEEMKKLADYVGASAEHPAVIPLFRYSFGTKDAESNDKAAISADVKELLDNLTPGIKFTYATELKNSWSGFVSAYSHKTNTFTLHGAGADYDGANSNNQQYLCNYGNFGEIQYFREALGLVDTDTIQGLK